MESPCSPAAGCCSGCCGGRCAACWIGSTPPGGTWTGRAPVRRGAVEPGSEQPKEATEMRVGDVMTRSVVTTTPRTLVKDAAIVLAGHGVTLLPVVNEDGRLVGVLTEADVVRGRIPPDPRRGAWRGSQAGSPPPAMVGEVMSSPPLTTDPHTDAAELATMMIDRALRSVPVIDEGRLVGIITRRDLVRTIARADALV